MQQFVPRILTVFVLIVLADSLDNGLALTPPMGFNTWSSFGCNINETIARANIDLMVDTGLVQAGYQYFNLDDCWHAKERVKQGPNKGQLTWNSTKFPSGIPALAEYAHSKGLKFGIYSDSGHFTCQHYPGSYGHEETDANTFASWGVDYLKYDNCYGPPVPVFDRYGAMSGALNSTGRGIVFSMCEWGWADPYLWAGSVGNSWRTTKDIKTKWVYIMRNLDGTIGLSQYAGPGAWNDPDLLQVGDLIWKRGFQEVYAAPLEDGSRAVVMLNRNEVGPISIFTVNWKDLGFPDNLSAKVRDLCEEKDIGVFNGSMSYIVGIFDAVMVKVSPIDDADKYMNWRPWDSAPFAHTTWISPLVQRKQPVML